MAHAPPVLRPHAGKLLLRLAEIHTEGMPEGAPDTAFAASDTLVHSVIEGRSGSADSDYRQGTNKPEQ